MNNGKNFSVPEKTRFSDDYVNKLDSATTLLGLILCGLLILFALIGQNSIMVVVIMVFLVIKNAVLFVIAMFLRNKAQYLSAFLYALLIIVWISAIFLWVK